jgi:hypothetical protein
MRRPPRAGNCTAPEAVVLRAALFGVRWGANGDSAGFGSLRARVRGVGRGPYKLWPSRVARARERHWVVKALRLVWQFECESGRAVRWRIT